MNTLGPAVGPEGPPRTRMDRGAILDPPNFAVDLALQMMQKDDGVGAGDGMRACPCEQASGGRERAQRPVKFPSGRSGVRIHATTPTAALEKYGWSSDRYVAEATAGSSWPHSDDRPTSGNDCLVPTTGHAKQALELARTTQSGPKDFLEANIQRTKRTGRERTAQQRRR
jgi:hypothetical protein